MEMAETTSLYHRHPCAALEAVQRTGAGKYVLVTGAARDIGRTIALSWAKAGAAGIAICSQNAEDLEQVVAELRRLTRRERFLPQPATPQDQQMSPNYSLLLESSLGSWI